MAPAWDSGMPVSMGVLLILLSFIALVACVQILFRSGDWLLAAGVFTIVRFGLTLFSWDGSASILITPAVIGALAFGYFWLLHRFEDTGARWLVLLLGVLLLA